MASDPVRAVPWEYLGGDVITSPENGYSGTQVTTLPRTCTIIELRPDGGNLYFEINGAGISDLDVPGFVANGSGQVIGPLAGLERLDVLTLLGGSVHIMFFRQKEP